MNQRLERINNLIRDEISAMLRKDLHDPLIGFVTITDVEVSPDLRHAKVFFSVLGDPEQVQNSIKGLLRARKFINSRLAERIELRYIPKLRFILDETAAKAQRMATLLHQEQAQLAEDLERHEAENEAALAPEEEDWEDDDELWDEDEAEEDFEEYDDEDDEPEDSPR